MKKKYRKFNVQFHMLPDELVQFVQDMMERHTLNLQLERWFPDRTLNVSARQNLKNVVHKFGYPRRIWLLLDDLQLKPNGEYLMLNMGKLANRLLTESQLGGRTSSDDAYKTWRLVFTELKERVPAGGWVINPELKIKGFSNRLHFSLAAAAASRRGEVVLKDMSGEQSQKFMVPDEPNLELPAETGQSHGRDAGNRK